MFRIRLKELRESRNLSQYELADELGVKQSTVAMWENGTNKPRHSTLIKIARFFNVQIDYISGESNSSTPAPALEKEISDIDIMIATESKDLSDKDKQEILHLIQYKKRQTEAPTSPFESSRARTTINFEDDTERIAAFGGMEDTDDEPLTT